MTKTSGAMRCAYRALRGLGKFGFLRVWRLSSARKMVVLLVPMAVLFSGCDDNSGGLTPKQVDEIHAKNKVAVAKCTAKWKDQRHVHIRGSEYELDQTKLPWEMEFGNYWSDDADCGAAAILGLFFWNGKEIIPERIGFQSPGYNAQLLKGWVAINVKALLGAPADAVRRAKQHRETISAYPTLPARTWPAERLIRLKNYPELVAIAPDPNQVKKVRALSFILSTWPRDDSSPRTISCDLGKNSIEFSRAEIEHLDFARQKAYCQIEFMDFTFHGGSARLNWGSDALPRIIPILRALNDYLNTHIRKEKV